MGWYHSIEAGDDVPRIVWHICPKSHWNDNCAEYTPKTYDEDKFTRASHMPDRLMETANCFYKDDKEMDWVCLQIDTSGLSFHGIEIKMVDSTIDSTLKCPHIFGSLPRGVINNVFPVQRTEDGTFVLIKGLTDHCTKK
jgi:uncharacterized protein (DUF952 family)